MGKQAKGEEFRLPKANPRLERCPRCGSKFKNYWGISDTSVCSRCGKKVKQPVLSRIPPSWQKLGNHPEYASQFTSMTWKRLRENRG